jgi:genetic interactor of prohibitins 3, mitochondrial
MKALRHKSRGQALFSLSRSARLSSRYPTFLSSFNQARHVANQQVEPSNKGREAGAAIYDYGAVNVWATDPVVQTKQSSPPSIQPVPLPTTCPGCGALSQEADTSEAGYYTRTRKSVKKYLDIFSSHEENLASFDPDLDEALEDSAATEDSKMSMPLCDRCHTLVHEHKGFSIAHPSIENVADSIAESPFKTNHIWHVLDAADFPMSLIPSIQTHLDLARPRSKNRRSQHDFSTRPTMSFLITRADLLGPTKEHVDRLMPYIREVLRKALGSAGEKMRLGNMKLVSAKRGWWTTDVKETIYKTGGGHWLVGKFNVGKSNLLEVIFPKGSGERAAAYTATPSTHEDPSAVDDFLSRHIPAHLNENQLLPPPQPEAPFPTLPLVSSLPGTTASPIRLPFRGRSKKGEVIDMPGLSRGDLDTYIQTPHKLDLVMTARPRKVDSHTIKPGQSLLLGGGVVRITPLLPSSDDATPGTRVGNSNGGTRILAYPFVPLKAHITSTEKAIGTQAQSRESGIESILAPEAGAAIKSAGIFTLDTDVTKRHAGPMLRAGLSMAQLPFRVFATDLLVEGVGWVQLVAQVRRRARNVSIFDREEAVASIENGDAAEDTETSPPPNELDLPTTIPFKPFAASLDPATAKTENDLNLDFDFPQIEVFTPNGRHVGSRTCMDAASLWEQGKPKKTKTASRPSRFGKSSRR